MATGFSTRSGTPACAMRAGTVLPTPCAQCSVTPRPTATTPDTATAWGRAIATWASQATTAASALKAGFKITAAAYPTRRIPTRRAWTATVPATAGRFATPGMASRARTGTQASLTVTRSSHQLPSRGPSAETPTKNQAPGVTPCQGRWRTSLSTPTTRPTASAQLLSAQARSASALCTTHPRHTTATRSSAGGSPVLLKTSPGRRKLLRPGYAQVLRGASRCLTRKARGHPGTYSSTKDPISDPCAMQATPGTVLWEARMR
mmetsp:Transcript_6698/g.23285  ORF Transcript_6698/g.23285 Transcript_6698/m.23285 type:complete len:262 (-) Transcript_6698:13679-14464(-)